VRPALDPRKANHVQATPVISIIDDDESFRTAMHGLLRSCGFSVDTFASAEDFLQSPRANDTSCLITDVQMPGMSGLELQSRMIAQGSRMPVIFVSAYLEERVRMKSLQAGAVGFLAKPFDDQMLLDCLNSALERGRGEVIDK
jgi:FixJ family two-component response regulator